MKFIFIALFVFFIVCATVRTKAAVSKANPKQDVKVPAPGKPTPNSKSNDPDQPKPDVKAENGTLRSVLEFRNLIARYSKISPWKLNGYGNYCGLGGSGVPIDGIDTCCQTHDKCYENMTPRLCITYIIPYSYTGLSCNPGQSNCATSVCRCDVEMVNCLNRQTNVPAKLLQS